MGRRGKTCADTTELSRLLPSLAPHIQHQTPRRERKPRGLRVPCLRRKPPQRPGASVLGEPHCHSRSAQQLQFHAWLSFPEMCWDVTSGARTRALKIARLMCCQMPACCQLSPPQGSWGVGDMAPAPPQPPRPILSVSSCCLLPGQGPWVGRVWRGRRDGGWHSPSSHGSSLLSGALTSPVPGAGEEPGRPAEAVELEITWMRGDT